MLGSVPSEDLYRHWGENIRLQRHIKDKREGLGDKRKGLGGSGVVAMAKALDVTPETVSRWESGKLAPRDAKKIEIARYLGVDPRMLFPLVDVLS